MRSRADLMLQSKRDTDSGYNLLSTGGGKFFLPADSDWDALREAVAEDSGSGTPNFLGESKTSTFPFFLDIDFAHPTLGLEFVEGPLLTRILRGVADALSPVLPVTHQEVLVAAAPTKQVKGGTKTGVHLHWQWLRLGGGRKLHLACTTDTAVGIRACILRQLAALPPQDPPLAMEDVVDRRVLEKNGCRMLFSGKSLPCDLCMAARKQAGKDLPCRRPELDQPTWRCPCPACREADARLKVRPPVTRRARRRAPTPSACAGPCDVIGPRCAPLSPWPAGMASRTAPTRCSRSCGSAGGRGCGNPGPRPARSACW